MQDFNQAQNARGVQILSAAQKEFLQFAIDFVNWCVVACN